MSVVEETIHQARALVVDLDLGETESEVGFVHALQQRRSFQLETLTLADPGYVPTAALVRLKTSRREEITLAEQALTLLGAPFDAPEEAE